MIIKMDLEIFLRQWDREKKDLRTRRHRSKQHTESIYLSSMILHLDIGENRGLLVMSSCVKTRGAEGNHTGSTEKHCLFIRLVRSTLLRRLSISLFLSYSLICIT